MMKKSFLIITILYLILEVIYNIGLVEFLTSKNTEIAVYDLLENFGKTLSAIGVSLVVTKFIASDKKKLLVACGLIPFVFVAETIAFDKIVDALTPETKVASYYAGVYRNTVLNNTIEDKQLSRLTPYNRVVLADIASYAATKSVRSSVDSMLYATMSDSTVDGMFFSYAAMSDSINALYQVYALESKKILEFKGQLGEELVYRFKKKSGGIAPGLDREEFFKEVSVKSPSLAKFNSTVFMQANAKLGIPALKGSDIPLGLDKRAFGEFIKGRVSLAQEKTKINPQTVMSLPFARELISSVVIPPIALLLSFVSIVLNTSLVLFSVRKWLVVLPGAVVAVAIVVGSPNPYGFSPSLHGAISLEAHFYQVMAPAAGALHAVFINDKAPNSAGLIVIKKPDPINFEDLKKQMAAMEADQVKTDVDTRLQVDEKKLKSDSAYYGELKTGHPNPYTN